MISRSDASATSWPSAAAGFTLIEMIVVLAIAGIAMSIVAANRTPVSAATKSRAAARSIYEALRAARSEALVSNRDVSFTVDVAHRSYAWGQRQATCRTACSSPCSPAPKRSSTAASDKSASIPMAARAVVAWSSRAVSMSGGSASIGSPGMCRLPIKPAKAAGRLRPALRLSGAGCRRSIATRLGARAGFTLIEVLVAVAISGIALASLRPR